MELIKLDKKVSDLIIRSVNTFGIEAQDNMAIEEMSELIQSLMKVKRLKLGDPIQDVRKVTDSVHEELADAILMLLQLAFVCYNTDKIEKVMHKKLDRLKSRLDDFDRMFNQKQKDEG